MNKNEIVVFNEKGEVAECTFKRVNFEEPATIIGYCDDVIDEIGSILDNTAKMSVGIETMTIDTKMIESITSLDKGLDESEEQRDKQTGLLADAVSFFTKIFNPKKAQEENAMATYQGRYHAYCSQIDEVAKGVQAQRQDSLNDIELRKSIVADLEPLVKILEDMVKVGHIDKDNYDLQTSNLAEKEQSQDGQYLVQYRTKLSETFGQKLNALEKSVVLYKEQIQSYRLQQSTDMELVMAHTSYLKEVSPYLKAQGSVMVFNREQRERIDIMSKLNAAANVAIQNNAQELEQNAADVVALSTNQGFSMETITKLDAALKKGVEMFKQGRIQKKEQIEKEHLALSQINSSITEYQQEVLKLIEDDEEVIKKISNPTSPKTRILSPNRSRK